jgi:hypothetical protein
MRPTVTPEALDIYKSAPGNKGRNLKFGSQGAITRSLIKTGSQAAYVISNTATGKTAGLRCSSEISLKTVP